MVERVIVLAYITIMFVWLLRQMFRMVRQVGMPAIRADLRRFVRWFFSP